MYRWAQIVVVSLFYPALALGAEEIDIQQQYASFGFPGVAMIIGAYEKSDRPAGEIQTLMATAILLSRLHLHV